MWLGLGRTERFGGNDGEYGVQTSHRAKQGRRLYTEPSGTKVAEATVTLTSTGFTLSWGTNDGAARIWNYEADGGSDLTAKVISGSQAAGSVAYTVGFPASVVFFIAGNSGSLGNSPVTPVTNWDLSYGACVGTNTGTAGGVGGQSATGLATSATNVIETPSVVTWLTSSAPGIYQQATCSAFDATTFTLTYSMMGGAAGPDMVFLAIGGGAWTAGISTQPPSIGNQSLTTAGMIPKGITLFSVDHAHSTTYQSGLKYSFGGSDGTNYFSDFVGAKTGATVQVASTSMSQSSLLNMMTEGGATPTTQAIVDTVAFSSGAATLHWSAADAVAREFVWVAMGAPPATGAIKHKVIQ